MTAPDPERSGRPEAAEPEVYLMPLALPEPLELDGLDGGVLSRRLPDFLHQVLNAGGPGPTGMLEIQSPPEGGPVRWVTLVDVPEPDEVLAMIEHADSPRAIVTGTLRQHERGLQVELGVYFADASIDEPQHGLRTVVTLDDPVGSLCRVARHLARVLGLRYPQPTPGALTSSPEAFYKYLEGLDGAALLSGDPELESDREGEDLVVPFAEALRIDPRFGLALRTAAATFFVALEGERVGEAACYRMIDRCFDTLPTDGDGCVAVAEQLALVGDEKRALAWLRHAAQLEPPTPRALESLGVMVANRGDLVAARDLWLKGLAADGHPDFFAHLGRLAFSEGSTADAWDKVLRGLRRMYERAVRAAEWLTDSRRPCVLTRYLHEHLEDESAPEEVVEALVDLSGLLEDAHERVDLGLCLAGVGRREEAASELRAGLGGELPPSVHDRAVRALLVLDVPDFERRFSAASDAARSGRDPRPSLVEMQAWLERAPDFWPALFFAGVALRRLGQEDEALDLMAEVLARRPGQSDALVEMARMFDRRGNPKRALECAEEALVTNWEDVDLHALRATFLEHLGRRDEAAAALDVALELEPSSAELRRRRRGV